MIVIMIKKIFLILIIILALVVSISCLKEGSKMKEEKIKMQEWLKEEYGKEFVVKSVEHYTEYLGAPKEIKGKAYPVDDKELVFDIRKFEDGHMWSLGKISSQYNERYLWLLWEKQAKEKMKNLVPENNYLISIKCNPIDILSELEGRTINLNEVKEQFGDKISIEIVCALVEDSSDSRLDKVFSIINSYKDTSYKEISLRVVFFDKSYEKKLEENFEKYIYSEKSTYEKMKKNNDIKIEYKINNINNVNVSEEINSYVVSD